MKNIVDVNSDDILTQLNNLDYGSEDDLKLLDDEDIRPISSKTSDDDLLDFYKDYTPKQTTQKVVPVDMYTEKPKEEVPAFEEKTIKIETPKEIAKQDIKIEPSIDTYLNRSASTVKTEQKPFVAPQPVYKQPVVSSKQVYESPKPNVNIPRPLPNYANSQNKSEDINDINQLFNKVSDNVKGASKIVNRNAEIKKKIEVKFEELRKMQEEHEANKARDYQEINAYKDDVYAKLQKKKTDMEKELSELRSNQEKFDKEKKEFEGYKNTSLANLSKMEKELKDAYENRGKNIEQVEIGLVKRKEQLDIEREELAKEREKIQKEKDELAKNLMQFNKLVSEFTQGIGDFG